jgi:hypothetical protein
MMVFEFGNQRHPRYSDNALRKLHEANTAENVESAWRKESGSQPPRQSPIRRA